MNNQQWESLVESHYREIYAYCFRLLGNSADAEDATQRCFEKAFKKLEQLGDPARARAWLYSIARNTSYDHLRSWKRLLQFIGNTRAELPVALTRDSELAMSIESLVMQLPLKQREVFALRHWQGFSTEETARLLGITQGTVKSHLSRAIKALKAELYSEDDFSKTTRQEAGTSLLTKEKHNER